MLLKIEPSPGSPFAKRMRFIDNERASEKILAIASADASIRHLLAHFNKTKSPGLSGKTVCHQADRIHRKPVAREPVLQFPLAGLIGQIPNEHFFSQILPETLSQPTMLHRARKESSIGREQAVALPPALVCRQEVLRRTSVATAVSPQARSANDPGSGTAVWELMFSV